MKSVFGVVVLLCALAGSTDGQSQPSIQGVWRPVERVIPRSTTAGDRVDPFGHVPVGTQTDPRTPDSHGAALQSNDGHRGRATAHGRVCDA